MKKHLLMITLLLPMIFSFQITNGETPVSSPIFGIKIAFSSRAYWDGETQGCLPRARGWCLHISVDSKSPVAEGTIVGEISFLSTTGVTLTLNKRTGITPETFSQYFRKGKFYLDGEGTMSEELARKLNLQKGYVIPAGEYGYRESGDLVTITFKK